MYAGRIKNKKNEEYKHNKGKETFSDLYSDTNPDVRRRGTLSSSFPAFWFHAEPNGFLWIGDFLLQWIQASGKDVYFMVEYDIPLGAYTTSYGLNTGGDSIVSPLFFDLSRQGVKFQSDRCEFPQFTISYGIKFQNEHYTRITYNRQETKKKSELFKTYAQPTSKHYIPEAYSPINACPEIKHKKLIKDNNKCAIQ